MRVIVRSFGFLLIIASLGLLFMRCGGDSGGGSGDDAEEVEATVEGDVVSGTFSAAATTPQRLTVAEGTISGSAVTIPAGALGVDVAVSIQPETDVLLTETLTTELGVDGSLSDAGPAVRIAPSQAVAVNGALSITIPTTAAALRLQEGGFPTVIVRYAGPDGNNLTTLINSSAIELNEDGSTATFPSATFGSFQYARSSVAIGDITPVDAGGTSTGGETTGGDTGGTTGGTTGDDDDDDDDDNPPVPNAQFFGHETFLIDESDVQGGSWNPSNPFGLAFDGSLPTQKYDDANRTWMDVDGVAANFTTKGQPRLWTLQAEPGAQTIVWFAPDDKHMVFVEFFQGVAVGVLTDDSTAPHPFAVTPALTPEADMVGTWSGKTMSFDETATFVGEIATPETLTDASLTLASGMDASDGAFLPTAGVLGELEVLPTNEFDLYPEEGKFDRGMIRYPIPMVGGFEHYMHVLVSLDRKAMVVMTCKHHNQEPMEKCNSTEGAPWWTYSFLQKD